MGIFRKTARSVGGVDTQYPYIFFCLTASFRSLRDDGLIDDELMNELFDALLSFWNYLFLMNAINEYEYSTFFIMARLSPKEKFIYSYELSDEDMTSAESITASVMNEFQKYRSVDLRRTTEDSLRSIPFDVIRLIESKGFECPVGSPNYVMAYAVGTTFGYIISRTDLESRMERVGKRLLASEILPVFLSFWYFRKENVPD